MVLNIGVPRKQLGLHFGAISCRITSADLGTQKILTTMRGHGQQLATGCRDTETGSHGCHTTLIVVGGKDLLICGGCLCKTYLKLLDVRFVLWDTLRYKTMANAPVGLVQRVATKAFRESPPAPLALLGAWHLMKAPESANCAVLVGLQTAVG